MLFEVNIRVLVEVDDEDEVRTVEHKLAQAVNSTGLSKFEPYIPDSEEAGEFVQANPDEFYEPR